MGIKKNVVICDCCKEEIDGKWLPAKLPKLFGEFKNRYYKIPGYMTYLGTEGPRMDDLIICRECMDQIIQIVKNKQEVNFNIEIE